MVNVFVGVVIEKYNENKEASQGAGMLTNKQKLWLETMKLAMTGKAIRQDRPPHQFWRKPFFTLVKMSYFDSFIMLCIGLNTVVLMATQFDEGEEAEARAAPSPSQQHRSERSGDDASDAAAPNAIVGADLRAALPEGASKLEKDKLLQEMKATS